MNFIDRILDRSGEMKFLETSENENAPTPERYHHAISLAKPKTSDEVLDIGCWTGSLLKLVSKTECKLTGVDIKGPWLDLAIKQCPRANFFSVDDYTSIDDTHNNKYDIIFFLETIEHIKKNSEVDNLKKIRTMLKSNGRVVLSTPCSGIAALLDPAWYLVGHRHYRKATLQKYFLEAFPEFRVSIRYSGTLLTSVDTIMFYITKHLLKTKYVSPRCFKASRQEKLSQKRTIFSNNIFVVAEKI